MLLAALCLLLVAIATAQPRPEPCCLPDTYSVVMTDMTQYGETFTGYNELMADNPNRRYGIKTWTSTGTLVNRIVQDYRGGKQYIIQPDGSCNVVPFDIPFIGNCIPKNAEFLGTSYIGQRPTEGTVYSGWRFPLGQHANVSVAVDKSCVPFVEKVKGKLGSYSADQIYFFNNYQEGITDPTVFDIPPSCQQ